MFVRNLLLVVGVLCMLGGVALSVVWVNQIGSTRVEKPAAPRPAVLVAAHAVPAGTLLRPEDLKWKELGADEILSGNLLRGQILESDFVGAITRRGFTAGEQLIASELVKPSERQFLAAVLKPGTRAVSIAVDGPQSAAGLVLPGDQVDVILTQSFGESPEDPARKTVAETVLRDARIIAVDQTLSATPKPGLLPRGAFTAEPKIPKLVTFELTEPQAERLVVASQLGRLQLSVRPLEVRAMADAKPERARRPTWASDVSPALSELGRKLPQSGSSIENSIRRPPVTSQ